MISRTKKTSCYFKHWTRQGYAMFASLHKVVKICVVTFTCTLVQEEFQPVFAQADSTDTTMDVRLHEVEVSANPTMLWSESARSVSIVEQKEILASPAQSIDDILEKIPGVDIRQRGSDGVQSDISINGGSFDQVLILLNGVNITDPQTGHHNLNLPVDISQIQRIEVLKGSGARTLGSNAFCGAINIITTSNDTGKGLHGQAGVSTGSYGFLNGTGAVSYQNKSLQLGASVSYKESDGYISNTDYCMLNSHVHASYKSAYGGNFLFQTGYQQKDFGANNFYSFSYPNQFEATRTLFSSLSWDKTFGNNHLQAQIYERRHHDRFELFRDMKNAASWYKSHNYHLTDVAGASLKFSVPLENSKIIYGTEMRNEHIFSNILGETMSGTRNDPFDENTIFTMEKNRTNYSVFVDQTFHLGNFTFSGGLNGNLNSDFGFFWHGGTDLSWNISKSFKSWLSFNRSVRLPTFTDLYYKSVIQASNPNLVPETALTLERGISFDRKKLHTSAAFWYRWGNNIIDWVKFPDSTKWESQNITKVNAFGVNVYAEYSFGQGFLQNIRTDYTYQHLNKKAEGYDSKYALDYLKHKGDIRIALKLFKNDGFGKISAVLNTSFYDRAGTWTDFATGVLKTYKPYLLCDTRIIWNRQAFSIHFDANNLFNTEYADFGGMVQPGIMVRAGLKIGL